ncbi:O-antigen ligase family protein [Mesorhizobium sp. GR13]|nr:O-antigen ligase family protein [Mesorhizobium sp. GR13]
MGQDRPNRTVARGTARSQKRRLPWPVKVFLVSLLIPWIIPIGPVVLSAYRIVLLLSLVPCLIMWLRGRAGPIRAPDIGVLFFCIWATISVAVVHGISFAMQPSGILLIETMGAYLLARIYIRDAEDFSNMVGFVTKLVLLLFPFAAYEWFTGNKPLLWAFGLIFKTVESAPQPRSGFWRVQGPFEHSILFGLFCASVLALAAMVPINGQKSGTRKTPAIVVFLTALSSMSSAPIAALAMQSMLMLWNRILRSFPSRWKILGIAALAAYLVVEFGSNQTPVQFYISKFTFDQQTGWVRLLIWEFGSASVLNHPLFGVGFGEWERPVWMPSSIDNFWLVIAVRYGIPGVAFLLGACLWMIFAVGFKKGFDEKLENYRLAYLISTASCMIIGTTVHFWAAPYSWFLFLVGTGAWMLDVKGDGVSDASGRARARGRSPSGRASHQEKPGRYSDETAPQEKRNRRVR